MSEFLGHCARK